ncbi:MAG: hypothetical protein ABUL62_15360 [Myxococcales bacterium]
MRLALATLSFLYPALCHAQPTRIEFEAGISGGIAFGHTRFASGSDTATESNTNAIPDAHLALHARLWPQLSLGVRADHYFTGSGHDPSNSNNLPVDFHFWRAAVDGRFHLLGERAVDPFLELEAGVAHASESGPGSGSASGRTTATIGSAFGVNFALGRYLALGPELRAVLLPFRGESSDRNVLVGSPIYGTNVIVSVGLNLSVRIPAR